jgi:hypothetical protein
LPIAFHLPYDAFMDQLHDDPAPPTYPPGFEPPTDINVPWYAWLVWPTALLAALFLAAMLFRGCMGALT